MKPTKKEKKVATVKCPHCGEVQPKKGTMVCSSEGAVMRECRKCGKEWIA